MNLRRIAFFEVIHTFLLRYVLYKRRKGYGSIGKGSFVHTPSITGHGQKNIFLGDDVNIDWGNVMYCDAAKFIMKDRSGAAIGLTVVTGNHVAQSQSVKDRNNINGDLQGKEIVVEEEVWLAANVTLLAGAHIGRGAIIGAGSVVRNCSIPPYAIAIGNPVKVIGFKWTVDEMLAHENAFYPEDQRIDKELLEKNYKKYFLDRYKEIKQFVRV